MAADNHLLPLISSALAGVAMFGIALAGQPYGARGLQFVEDDLTEKLRALRMRSNHVRAYLLWWLVLIGAVFLVLGIYFQSLLVALLLCLLMACAPWYLIRRLAQQRRERVEMQLADAMVTFSNAVRAGLSLAQSLDILATQCPRPVSEEFRQIVGEYKLGKPLERTLREAKERLRSENFSLFAAALLASRRSGGQLNETVERIAHSVLEAQRLERKLQVETAQARKSAVYMALVPPAILVVYYFVDPENTVRLFTTFPGQVLLAASILLNLMAYLWARVILNPEI
ncbi:MAG TPA: type II secretion system F family protein [Pirellulaceae bacterium]|nr:type II secretion system F family protein [Pirellulaceae bacterium]